MSLEVFRAEWPILDDSQPLSAIKSDAKAEFLDMIRRAEAELIGDIAWAIHGFQIVALASVIPPVDAIRPRRRARWGSVAARAEDVLELHSQGYTYEHIGELLGCSGDAAKKVAIRARKAAA